MLCNVEESRKENDAKKLTWPNRQEEVKWQNFSNAAWWEATDLSAASS